MKKIVIVSLIAVLTATFSWLIYAFALEGNVQNQINDAGKTPRLVFEFTEHDCGKVKYNEEATITIPFSNTGDGTLNIYEIKSSCECTVAELSKNTYRPKEKNVLEITIEPEMAGDFWRTVKIFSNDSTSPVKIEVKGEFVKK